MQHIGRRGALDVHLEAVATWDIFEAMIVDVVIMLLVGRSGEVGNNTCSYESHFHCGWVFAILILFSLATPYAA